MKIEINSTGSVALERGWERNRRSVWHFDALHQGWVGFGLTFLLVGGGVRGVRGEVIWLVMVLGPPWGSRHCGSPSTSRGTVSYVEKRMRTVSYVEKRMRDAYSSDLPQ